MMIKMGKNLVCGGEMIIISALASSLFNVFSNAELTKNGMQRVFRDRIYLLAQ